jgi:hypothetical protein
MALLAAGVVTVMLLAVSGRAALGNEHKPGSMCIDVGLRRLLQASASSGIS